MAVRLKIHGERDDADLRAVRGGGADERLDSTVADLVDSVDVVDSFNLSPAARERAAEPTDVEEYLDDDLLEFEVEGGFTTWTSAKRYSEDVRLLRKEARDDDAVTVDTLPQVSDRGVSEWVANKLRVLRVKDNIKDIATDPTQWPTSLDDLKELAQRLGLNLAKLPAWLITKALIRLIEDRLEPGPGLFTWEDATKQPWSKNRSPANFDHFDVEKPILVFIHGTASSTRGSFSAFLPVDVQAQWEELKKLFDGGIYAFEHRTLSDSPVDNAIDLLEALPPNARVNIVSHSRGGLVGDLISMTSVNEDLLARFDRKDPELKQADAYDRQQLEKLEKLIAEKQIRIERFVRCASPSRGTLLAGENIDVFLSVLTNLVGLIPAVGGTPLYEVTKRIALEIIRSRTEPSLVPGLEAMMPQSPLVALLNNMNAPADSGIGVVAGDIAGGNWLKRLGVFASDHIIYESRDNDLVVNTDAMFHGVRRSVAGYVFDQGADVSHFNYFRNPRTRAALVDWLSEKRGELPKSFTKLPVEAFEPVPMPRSMQTPGVDRPVVFVLPDLMGSHLKVGPEMVWPDYHALLNGKIRELAVDAAGVEPSDLVGAGYRELCDHLQHSHVVIPFAYDWRLSIADAATRLATAVEDRLDQTKQPVRFIAHGMGGLVVRAMIASPGDLWDRICQRDGGRLVMLGTPNRGSFDVVETLLGASTTIRQLALLDLENDVETISDIVAKFPGVLELLPDMDEYFGDALWNDYRQKRGGSVPEQARLAAARETLKSIAAHVTSVIPHADRVLYVAGASPRTVTGVEIVDGRVVLLVTPEGDGRVTYESGHLPGVPMWYMQAAHGDLASHSPSFRALTELLENGTTARLSTAPPSTTTRGGPVVPRALPEPVLYPTESSLAGGILGKQPRRSYQPEDRPAFRVKVVHGDLQYAHYPIVVGHYEGDTIVGAEAQVDKRLGGALSQRYSLGLYPGALGSIAVILRKPTVVQEALHMSSGAVVMGLGKWGELGAGQLADLLRRAALQYVLQRCDGLGPSTANGEDAPKVGLSVLLVGGASTTNITVGDSVGAILRAIAQANRELAGGSCKAMTIQELEIIELYADRATEAAHAVNQLAPLIGNDLETDIEAVPLLLDPGRAGRKRLRLSSERAAWRRWEVSVVTPPRRPTQALLPEPLLDLLKQAVVEHENADAELLKAISELAFGQTAEPDAHRVIRFLTLSERARAEATSQHRQPELVERLIKTAISQTRFFREESRVLFELMVPNELKSGLVQVDNLVLVVDEETAAYPWELMSAGDKPLCVAKGMVRQLQTSNYRPQIGTRAGTAAFVVGDPKVAAPFQQLPGAEAEAKTVYEILRNRFEVQQPLSRPSALELLAGLYEKPYRIVHLAGHGEYKAPTAADDKARSGLVLDNGLFLTAVEVGQMQQVPELVFLNCCHIGQTGPEDTTGTSVAPGAQTVEFNRLAASVSRELIEMGVRAVVAAGWAVRDDAAKDFAETFYRSMLANKTFGQALKTTREHTFGKFPDTNTWGAYQAYGDPDYRLDPNATRDSDTGDGLVAVDEFVEAVRDIGATPVHDAASTAEAVKKLGELVEICPPGWREQTRVQIEIGLAYGNLGQLREARNDLERALAGEGSESSTTFFAVEQLANFEARAANLDTDGAKELHESAVARLEHLLAVAKTAERYNLLGGTYRRRAAAEPKRNAKKAREALAKAVENYRKAHELNQQRGVLHPYPTLNWLTWAAVLDEDVPGADELLARCAATAGERYVTDRKFYTAIGMADAHLARALMEDRLSRSNDAADKELNRLHEKYQQVIKQAAPNASELDSVVGQIDSIANLFEKLAPEDQATQTDATVARLRELRRRIAGEAPSREDNDNPTATP
jgi:CHAT domain-containing protein